MVGCVNRSLCSLAHMQARARTTRFDPSPPPKKSTQPNQMSNQNSVALGRQLGEGGFAFVYACTDAMDPGQHYVLKKILIQVHACMCMCAYIYVCVVGLGRVGLSRSSDRPIHKIDRRFHPIGPQNQNPNNLYTTGRASPPVRRKGNPVTAAPAALPPSCAVCGRGPPPREHA